MRIRVCRIPRRGTCDIETYEEASLRALLYFAAPPDWPAGRIFFAHTTTRARPIDARVRNFRTGNRQAISGSSLPPSVFPVVIRSTVHTLRIHEVSKIDCSEFTTLSRTDRSADTRTAPVFAQVYFNETRRRARER